MLLKQDLETKIILKRGKMQINRKVLKKLRRHVLGVHLKLSPIQEKIFLKSIPLHQDI